VRPPVLLVVAALVVAGAAASPAAAARTRWDTRVLGLVPTPGFPANAYPAPDGRVYEGTYDDPRGNAAASRVLEYDAARGTLTRSWTVSGQDRSGAHGVQVATSDAAGRLVLLDKAPPRVLLLDRTTGAQTTYASFPAGAVPNHAAWGSDGSLYVTDYGNAVLWRVPPHGGTPQPWLRDTRLDGGPFGATGIALAADRSTLLVAVQSEAGGGAGDPATGRLWTILIQPDGRPGPMLQRWESRPLDGPDAFGIARSGNVYIALLVANQIAIVGPDGTERERFPPLPLGGDNGSPVPFDNPSSARFLGTRLMVANQSYFTADPAHQAILDVETQEPGLPELIPSSAGPRAGGTR
jgi:sugar lactone lactonase YvrE